MGESAACICCARRCGADEGAGIAGSACRTRAAGCAPLVAACGGGCRRNCAAGGYLHLLCTASGDISAALLDGVDGCGTGTGILLFLCCRGSAPAAGDGLSAAGRHLRGDDRTRLRAADAVGAGEDGAGRASARRLCGPSHGCKNPGASVLVRTEKSSRMAAPACGVCDRRSGDGGISCSGGRGHCFL